MTGPRKETMRDSDYQKEYDKAEKAFDKGATLDEYVAEQEEESITEDEGNTDSPAETVDEPITTDEPEEEPGEETGDDEPAADEESEVERLKAELARQKKIAEDNHRFATQKAQEAARLKKEAEEAKSKLPKPAILDEIDGLEEGVAHIVEEKLRNAIPQSQEEPEPEALSANQQDNYASWHGSVLAAHPDFDELSRDPSFRNRIQALIDREGAMPEVTIAEVSRIKAETATRKKAAEQEKKGKLARMQVPTGGRGSKATTTPTNAEQAEIEKLNSMSLEDFAKMGDRAIMRGG